MKAIKLTALIFCAWAAGELSASAAWNNVFQPTCLFGRRPSTSNYCPSCAPAPVVAMVPAPACTSCAPPPVVACAPPVQQCTTNYIARSYYQPVTTYESRSFYEPVTTTQTSFYWEAVTTMQTSLYPDPCSCGFVARSSPVTSYQLRAQSCPVQSWVQRCAQVPVTSYRLETKFEPVTTCAPACPSCPTCPTCPQTAAAPAAPCPSCAPAQTNPTPSYSSPPPPVIDNPKPAPQGPNVGNNASYYPSANTTNMPKSGWQPANVTLGPIQPEGDVVRGQVSKNDKTPNANTQVLFVNTTTGNRHSATTNASGQFNLPLAAGNYHVYLANQSGGAAYHSMVNVKDRQSNVVNLVN